MKFISDITVRCVQQMGGDLSIVRAARVSTRGGEAETADESEESQRGLIRYLIRHHHGSSLEHSLLTFFVHAPAFVWWEWTRHRIGQTVDCNELSFNLESGRYRELEPVFWLPRPERPMVKGEGYKPARPKFDRVNARGYVQTLAEMESAYQSAWHSYSSMIARGIAPEVARSVLGFGVYYSGWVSCNPRSLMHFLSLRTHNPDAAFVSYPQAEIEEAALACEEVLKLGWPIAHAAFNEFGRVAP